jgi:hypothetical protein
MIWKHLPSRAETAAEFHVEFEKTLPIKRVGSLTVERAESARLAEGIQAS